MKHGIGFRPSIGFVMLVASYTLLLSFLAWGYARPELDRCWYILQKMQRDDLSGLSKADRQVLQRALAKHERFAHALLGKSVAGFVEPTEDGWSALRQSHIVIASSPNLPLRVVVDCRAPHQTYPVVITLEAEGREQRLEFAADTQMLWDMSPLSSSHAQWVTVTVTGHGGTTDKPSSPQIRIRPDVDESPKAASWR